MWELQKVNFLVSYLCTRRQFLMSVWLYCLSKGKCENGQKYRWYYGYPAIWENHNKIVRMINVSVGTILLVNTSHRNVWINPFARYCCVILLPLQPTKSYSWIHTPTAGMQWGKFLNSRRCRFYLTSYTVSRHTFPLVIVSSGDGDCASNTQAEESLINF